MWTPFRPRPRHARGAGPRRRVASLTAIALIIGIGAPTPMADAALANETFHSTPGVFGAVTVLGDSVLQGSVAFTPNIGDQLSARGWGPVRSRAGVGYSTGYFATTQEARATFWIDRWRDQGWDPPNVLINLGANDSGVCNRDLDCARNAILHLVEAIGPGHRIWWPMITRHELFKHQSDNWNLALQQIADERDDFFTWDWPSVMAAHGFSSGDNTHLTVDGYRERAVLMAHEFTADLAEGFLFGDGATPPAPTGAPSELVPIGPVRVIDTRIDEPGHVPADTAIEVDVSEYVPEGTTAIAAYVSATEVGGPGFLTAYECSAGRPDASAANYLSFETRGAVAITPVSPDGTFCLYTYADADLLVDLQAAFVPPGSEQGVRFDPLPQPERLLDTRITGKAEVLTIDVPDDATAVAVSITAVLSQLPGFLVAYPCGDRPDEGATVNHFPHEVISGMAFVPVSADGTICVWSLNPVDVTVDLTGTFSPDGELMFQPAPPTRMIDTRDTTGGWSPVHGREQTIDAPVAPPDAKAVTGTLTLVDPARPGFLTAWGCGEQPGTANVTGLAGNVLANSVTTGVDPDGRLCVYALSLTSTLFDTTGWWIPAGDPPPEENTPS